MFVDFSCSNFSLSHSQSQKLIQKGFLPCDHVMVFYFHLIILLKLHVTMQNVYTSLYLPVSIVYKMSIAGFHLGERKKSFLLVRFVEDTNLLINFKNF